MCLPLQGQSCAGTGPASTAAAASEEGGGRGGARAKPVGQEERYAAGMTCGERERERDSHTQKNGSSSLL